MRFPAVFCFFLFSVSSLAAVPSSEQGIPFDGKTGYALDAKSLGIDIRHFSVAAWVRVTEPAEVPDSMQMFVSMGKTNQDDFKRR